MTQKKSYSRFFIILQEDEKGYGIASDKQPSGYTKLETKNDKCKISYYVQNLKKESGPYYMILICSKKEVNKIVKIGELNIDENGRADVTLEYSENNIANSGIGIDKVTGAAIVKLKGNNVLSTLCGFASSDIPVWKKYEIVGESKVIKESKEVVEEYKEKVVVKEKLHEEIKVEKGENIFDKYEQKVEEIKVNAESPKQINNSDNLAIKEEIKENIDSEVFESKVVDTQMQFAARESQEEINSEKNTDNDSDVESKKMPEQVESFQNNEREKHKDDKDYPKGNVGKFFKNVIKDFEEVEEACKEIKRCRWYKVAINSLEEMYDTLDYNKYTVAYYPMINYYPYIKKYGHYMMGLKCDPHGKMKYLVYAVPGTKHKMEQPFGGKSGFVTWVPVKEDIGDDSFGYWLMFYDFRTSTIVIPVR